MTSTLARLPVEDSSQNLSVQLIGMARAVLALTVLPTDIQPVPFWTRSQARLLPVRGEPRVVPKPPVRVPLPLPPIDQVLAGLVSNPSLVVIVRACAGVAGSSAAVNA